MENLQKSILITDSEELFPWVRNFVRFYLHERKSIRNLHHQRIQRSWDCWDMLSQIAASSEDLDIWLDPRPRKQTQYYLLYTKQRKNQERDFYKTCFNWYNFYLDQINEELGVIFFSFFETLRNVSRSVFNFHVRDRTRRACGSQEHLSTLFIKVNVSLEIQSTNGKPNERCSFLGKLYSGWIPDIFTVNPLVWLPWGSNTAKRFNRFSQGKKNIDDATSCLFWICIKEVDQYIHKAVSLLETKKFPAEC